MFPEESFGVVDCERVEERWRRGQGYREGRDKKAGNWIGGRVTEWVKRDEVGERGRQRVDWKCGVHGWSYLARLIKWEEEEDEEEEDDMPGESAEGLEASRLTD
jgi:hypothetical protein